MEFYRFSRALAAAGALFIAAASAEVARAQAFPFLWVPTGSGDWNTPSNWDLGFVPSASSQEEGRINNGGTATLNSPIVYSVGSVVLGTAASESGTLSIGSGGAFIAEAIPNITTGVVTVGSAGTGTLNVTGTGTLTAAGLSIGGAAASQANFSGSATASISGTTNVARRLRITGPSVNFTSTGAVTFQGTGTLIADITSAAGHSTIKSPASVALGGTLNVQFTGVTPVIGNSWNLVDATSITGNFANAPIGGVVAVSGVPAPAVGSAYRVRQVPGGTNGQLLQVALENMLVLRVNRDTGEMTIRNPLGAAATQFDGYSITSAAGSLLASYKGISGAPAGNAGWEKAPGNSTTGLAEFKPTGVFDVSSTATNVSLGTGFSKTAVSSQPLGTSGEDLVFRYHSKGGAVVTGQIEYVGTPFLNNIALIVNTTNGQATLKNDTLSPLAIDGYSIVSSTGALSGAGWTTLASRPGSYPNWQASPAATNALSETNAVAPMTLAAGQSIPLGSIGNLSTAAAQAGLSLKFILGNEETFRLGTIRFTTGQAGDFDADGDVDGRDFLVWQRGGSPNPMSAGDLADWRANFGAGAASVAGAVPEPATLALGLAMTIGCALRRRTGRTFPTFTSRTSATEATRITNGQRIMNNSLLLLVLAPLALVLVGAPSALAGAPSLGLNFGAADPDTTTSSLAPSEVAGYFPAPNWNNLVDQNGTGVAGLFYTNSTGGASASSVSVTWSCPNLWRSVTGNNAFPEGPDRKLTAGYLDTNDADGIASITVTGLDSALITPKYDVFVYFVSDSGANRGGGYTIDDGTGPRVKYGSTMASPSTFIEDPGTDINNSIDGTFLRFTGLTGSSFTLTGDARLTTPNGFRAPINAVQIVAWTGDADGDGDTDINDYNFIRLNLEKPTAGRFAGGDLTGDAFIDLNDFRRWRLVAPPAVAASVNIPEPSTAVLALGAAALLARRVRRVRGGRVAVVAGCAAALALAVAAPAEAAVTMTFGTTAPTPGAHDQYQFLDDAQVPGGTTPGGGTYNSQAYSDNNGPPGQTFTTPPSFSGALPAYQLTSIWLKGDSQGGANYGGFNAATTWGIRISEVNGVNLSPVMVVTGVPHATGTILGDEWFTWTFTADHLRALQPSKLYAFDLYSSSGYLGFDATADDNSYPNGTAFNSGGGGARNFNGLNTGNLANHGYDRTFLVALTPSPLFGPGDVNLDGVTDLVDYGFIKANFFLSSGAVRSQGDLNDDGRVDIFDYAIWKNNAPAAVLAALGVPEPSALALAAFGGAACAVARRRRRGTR